MSGNSSSDIYGTPNFMFDSAQLFNLSFATNNIKIRDGGEGVLQLVIDTSKVKNSSHGFYLTSTGEKNLSIRFQGKEGKRVEKNNNIGEVLGQSYKCLLIKIWCETLAYQDL